MQTSKNQTEHNILFLVGYVDAINEKPEDLTQGTDWLRGHACGRSRIAQIRSNTLQSLPAKALAAAKDIFKSYRQLNEAVFDYNVSQSIAEIILKHVDL